MTEIGATLHVVVRVKMPPHAGADQPPQTDLKVEICTQEACWSTLMGSIPVTSEQAGSG